MKKCKEGTVIVYGVATLFPPGSNIRHLLLVCFRVQPVAISLVLGFLWKSISQTLSSSEGPDDVLEFL